MEKSVYRDENLVLLRLLKKCRVEAGLTQAEFAQALDRPQSFASDIERGLRRIDLVQLRDICHALGLGLVDFVQRFEAELSSKGAGE
ncbi:helix-turn-helix transcriptional regulator [Pseudomonas aeruginosa]|uniref:helix-turn-helix domain-containing protein n=1 Tax=Pseudomonas aeruginosa TaxID=287 RepID=UPI0009A17FC9|nr:helix-turn-helix transcriptional regulator [Pseudomonas aeruginosa]EKV0397707.1 helix-turn-helix transcriptional regulator [Pseudomonas aeruginosa]EKV3012717.1 helix-turn-helix transcriptional regulator [Pseudomonas aeruginosa]EKW6547224.1 helix-turn-helix transcriptional regulator [Pseudomonas aeruginosa]EMA4523519.1 helix-turn-helix transcriptional regulator [Pseudomonas aeruginosa]MBG4373778.1 helix-turn-helix transcriptional regulator [Pseudomonas aeruginosa]